MEYTIHFLEQHRDLLLSEATEQKDLSCSKHESKWKKVILKAAAKRNIDKVDELNEAIKILKLNVAP
jgi:hypothetical protein